MPLRSSEEKYEAWKNLKIHPELETRKILKARVESWENMRGKEFTHTLGLGGIPDRKKERGKRGKEKDLPFIVNFMMSPHLTG